MIAERLGAGPLGSQDRPLSSQVEVAGSHAGAAGRRAGTAAKRSIDERVFAMLSGRKHDVGIR